MKRTLSAVLLALSLALTGACSSQSGDSNPDNQTDEVPGDPESSRAPS